MKRTTITIFLALTMVLGAYTISHAASAPDSSPAQSSASSSDTALPASTASQLTKPGTLTSEYELEPEHAVYSAPALTWVIPGRNGMCLAMSAPDGFSIATGCGKLTNADTGGLVIVRRAASGPVIYGFAPPDASVTITNDDGSSVSPSVTDSVFMESDPTARSVTVRVGTGSVTTPIYQAAQ
jgi:hypothetical protein